ncbi:WbqC family protein [Desulfobacterales bacterium HSG17]|nr:WbqC family protein [Desulfobacterales bacterium HSG17]
MIAAIHQPQYLPWLGYFDKMDRADVFCYLDNVQFKKNEWQNRNRIKNSKGWQWITLPVCYRFPQKINDVEINTNVKWQRKHIQALITNYSKTPFFEKVLSFFKQIYANDYKSFARLAISINEQVRRELGVDTHTFSASEMNLKNENPTGRLIEICKNLGADTYLAGQDGEKYMDMKLFKEKGIKVIFQRFNHPVYPQAFGGFISHLSVVDLLFNCGDESMEIIRKYNPLQEGYYDKNKYSGHRRSS